MEAIKIHNSSQKKSNTKINQSTTYSPYSKTGYRK